MSSVLEDAEVDDWVDDELDDEASEPVIRPLVPVAAVVAAGLLAGLIFAIIRPGLTDVYDDGWIWGRLDWGVMGTVLWTLPLLALNRIPWKRLGTGRTALAAVTGAIPLVFVASSGPLAAILFFGVWMLATTIARRLGYLDGHAVKAVAWTVALTIVVWVVLENAADVDRVASTMRTTAIAVGVVGGIWIGLNLLVDTARNTWTVFAAGISALIAAIFFGIVRGNRGLLGLFASDDPIALFSGTGFLGHVEWSVVGAVIWGVGVGAITVLPKGPIRMGVGAATGAVTGYLIADNLKPWLRPQLEWGEIILFTLIGAAIGVGLRYRSRNFVPGALIGAGIGFTWAVWFTSNFGGSQSDAMLGAIVPLVLLGVRLGWGANPDLGVLSRFDQRARAAIFLGPALLFLTAALAIPAIITLILSFQDRDGEDFVGLDNYEEFLRDADSVDISNWTNIFTSQLFWVGVVLLTAGVLIGMTTGTRRHGVRTFERTGSSMASIAVALFLFSFAAFSVLRGTFFNNLWWVVTVVSLSTTLGLTIAVLSERAGRLESVAKSLIFMPMAVSFVGASIVWRLQYQPRDVSKNQTGVLNALWVELGQLSHSGWPRALALALLAALIALVVWRAIPRVQAGETFGAFVAVAIVLGYLFIELLRRSLGGFQFGPDGEILPDTVLFLQNPPFNNVFLMVILIWIQTGFAMVILSAAIKAVPTEFIEAARVDGANESQIFWNITLPQILPTVGVIVTTLIVLVTKVFDIVKVTTGGNFGTNVLANDMFTESFSFFNRGLGSAIAIFILISVLPVMIMNVRRMQRERSLR